MHSTLVAVTTRHSMLDRFGSLAPANNWYAYYRGILKIKSSGFDS